MRLIAILLVILFSQQLFCSEENVQENKKFGSMHFALGVGQSIYKYENTSSNQWINSANEKNPNYFDFSLFYGFNKVRILIGLGFAYQQVEINVKSKDEKSWFYTNDQYNSLWTIDFFKIKYFFLDMVSGPFVEFGVGIGNPPFCINAGIGYMLNINSDSLIKPVIGINYRINGSPGFLGGDYEYHSLNGYIGLMF